MTCSEAGRAHGVCGPETDVGIERELSRVLPLVPRSDGGSPLSGKDSNDLTFEKNARARASILRTSRSACACPSAAELRRSVSTLLRRGGRRILLDLSRVSALDAGGSGRADPCLQHGDSRPRRASSCGDHRAGPSASRSGRSCRSVDRDARRWPAPSSRSCLPRPATQPDVTHAVRRDRRGVGHVPGRG